MIKRLIILIFSLAVLIGLGLATSAAMAGEEGKVFGEVRWQYMGWDNAFDANSNVKDQLAVNWLRARLGYKAKVGDRAWAKFSVENLRIFGGDDAVAGYFWGNGDYIPETKGLAFNSGDNDAIFLHEAVLGMDDFLFRGFSAWGGRSGYAFGNERILGKNDWVMPYQNRFDGFGGAYKGKEGNWWMKLLCLTIEETGLDRYNPWEFGGDYLGDTWLRGIYVHYEASEAFWFEPYLFRLSTAGGEDADDSIADSFTLDSSSVWEFGALFDYEGDYGVHFYAEGVYQSGSMKDFDDTGGRPFTKVDTDITAFGAYAGLFYTFDSTTSPHLGVEWNYASGTKSDDASNNKMKTFMSPFGSYGEYMGRMNILDWANTSSFRFNGGLTATEGLNLWIDFWLFKLAQDEDTAYGPYGSSISGVDNDGDGKFDSKSVGTEVDFFAEYMVDEAIWFEGGLGIFSLGDYFGESSDINPLDSILIGYLGAKVKF